VSVSVPAEAVSSVEQRLAVAERLLAIVRGRYPALAVQVDGIAACQVLAFW
jgi:hypothetical protein